MSAVSNLTYVFVSDSNTVDPQQGIATYVFSNYDEAMSFGKWLDNNLAECHVWVWNYNGGSGRWLNSSWAARPNTNWP